MCSLFARKCASRFAPCCTGLRRSRTHPPTGEGGGWPPRSSHKHEHAQKTQTWTSFFSLSRFTFHFHVSLLTSTFSAFKLHPLTTGTRWSPQDAPQGGFQPSSLFLILQEPNCVASLLFSYFCFLMSRPFAPDFPVVVPCRVSARDAPQQSTLSDSSGADTIDAGEVSSSLDALQHNAILPLP